MTADKKQPNETGPEAAAEAAAAEVDAAFGEPVTLAAEAARNSVDEVAALRTQFDDAQGRALRAQAELENFRKRMRREMDEERRFAAQPLLRDLLPVLDNLQRALVAAERGGQPSGLLEGVRMVAGQFSAVLEQHGCRPIPAEGTPFDPNRHEAIAQLTRRDVPAGTVLEVYQSGYQLHDRIVRPAQVVVAVSPAEDETSP